MKQRNNIATFHGWHGNLSHVTPYSSSRTAFGDECPLSFPPYSLLEAVCLIQKQTSMTPEIKPRPCYFKSSH